MVTGDHPATALAIARQVGLTVGEERVLEGRDLPADDAVLGALIDHDGVVLSRVSPADKLRIARALQSRGHVVAMTGDGVNDGPALKNADIGVAMGRGGTDVARAAADLVLLDDDFSTIVAAVEQGRATFANIHRFLTYHLTDNVAELTPFVVWALSGGRFPLALGVLQILFLDIGTDLLPALALGNEPPSPGCWTTRPSGATSSIAPCSCGCSACSGRPRRSWRWRRSSWPSPWPGGAREMPSPPATPCWRRRVRRSPPVVLGQAANGFACRSATRWPGRLGWMSNRLLLWGVAVEVGTLVAVLAIAAARPPARPRRAAAGRAGHRRARGARGAGGRPAPQGGPGATPPPLIARRATAGGGGGGGPPARINERAAMVGAVGVGMPTGPRCARPPGEERTATSIVWAARPASRKRACTWVAIDSFVIGRSAGTVTAMR